MPRSRPRERAAWCSLSPGIGTVPMHNFWVLGQSQFCNVGSQDTMSPWPAKHPTIEDEREHQEGEFKEIRELEKFFCIGNSHKERRVGWKKIPGQKELHTHQKEMVSCDNVREWHGHIYTTKRKTDS